MIKTRDAEVYLTEQTVKELMWAIEKAKKEVEFTDKPMSNSDMSVKQFTEEQKKRGTIRVKSEYSKIEYVISIEGKTRYERQESLGYELV